MVLCLYTCLTHYNTLPTCRQEGVSGLLVTSTFVHHALSLSGTVPLPPLLRDVQSASSLTTFRRKLIAHLFQQSYPDIIQQ